MNQQKTIHAKRMHMKNFYSMTGSFEKTESSRGGIKKDKRVGQKNTTHRMKHDSEDYEEYFNTRYGNKLYKS
jgi:hypothetical protein